MIDVAIVYCAKNIRGVANVYCAKTVRDVAIAKNTTQILVDAANIYGAKNKRRVENINLAKNTRDYANVKTAKKIKDSKYLLLQTHEGCSKCLLKTLGCCKYLICQNTRDVANKHCPKT